MRLSKADKLYRITLTPKGIKIPKTEIELRDAELSILQASVEASANEAPKIPEIKQRMMMVDDLEAIADTDNYIDLSMADLDLIKQSFAKTAGRRPQGWLRCIALLDQLENPVALSSAPVSKPDKKGS